MKLDAGVDIGNSTTEVVVADNGTPVGVVTRSDLLEYLSRR